MPARTAEASSGGPGDPPADPPADHHGVEPPAPRPRPYRRPQRSARPVALPLILHLHVGLAPTSQTPSLIAASSASTAAAMAWIGIRPLATNWPPDRRGAGAEGGGPPG